MAHDTNTRDLLVIREFPPRPVVPHCSCETAGFCGRSATPAAGELYIPDQWDRRRGRRGVVFQDLVGTTGTVTVATRGPGGPGEVSLQVNGSRESFLATSDEPLPRGAVVLVVECRPHRSVAVVPWIEPGSQARPDPVPPSGPSRS